LEDAGFVTQMTLSWIWSVDVLGLYYSGSVSPRGTCFSA
jgi:hypothetical protein